MSLKDLIKINLLYKTRTLFSYPIDDLVCNYIGVRGEVAGQANSELASVLAELEFKMECGVEQFTCR